MVYISRWKGRTKEEVSDAMRALAKWKSKRMTKAERAALAKKMVKARKHAKK